MIRSVRNFRREVTVSCLVALFSLWLLRHLRLRFRRRVRNAKQPSSEKVARKIYSVQSSVPLEPRAQEVHLPPLMRSRVLQHLSFHDVYDIGLNADEEILGEGMNGTVRCAQHRQSGSRVAVKYLPPVQREELPEEVMLYLRLSHPNICRLLQAFIDQDGGIWLCMELCSGGELFELAAGKCHMAGDGSLLLDTEARIAVLVKQMAAALGYIHSMGIVHRDVKLENWVFASPAQERLKLIDFGLATTTVVAKVDEGVDGAASSDSRKLTQACGTCYYIAPEVLGVEDDGSICEGAGYGKEVDIWALGVLLYMLISGAAPFDGRSPAHILSLISELPSSDDYLCHAFQGARWRNVSPQCKHLISRCLERDPERRLTAAGVQQHPWLVDHAKATPTTSRTLQVILRDLCYAGFRMASSRSLACLCGYLACTIYISPDTWSELKALFSDLESLDNAAHRGVLSADELFLACWNALNEHNDCKLTSAEYGIEKDACEAAIRLLDLTGDGRLHFFEFVAAMIASGRVEVHDYDVCDAFAAFDLDKDGVISADDMTTTIDPIVTEVCQSRFCQPSLSLPIDQPQIMLDVLNLLAPWATEDASDSHRLCQEVSDDSGTSKPVLRSYTPKAHHRLLSKAELQLTWQVHRQFAFENASQAMRHSNLRSLHRGWGTPDPSPTRDDQQSEEERDCSAAQSYRGASASGRTTFRRIQSDLF